jgi:NitT/TauT family transport system permease protein
VLLRLSQELVTTMLWNHMLTTAWVAMTGVSVAILLGVTCGWLFYHHGRMAQLFQWMLTASQSLPVVAVAPLILLWIPHPFWARTTVATIITIYPVFAATYTALQVIPRELREVAHLNGASRLALLRYVEFPLALPVMLSGIQTSVVLALTGAVVGEYLGGRDGLGALINIARGLFDTTLVFVALVVLVAMTLLAYAGIHLVQQRVAQTFE